MTYHESSWKKILHYFTDQRGSASKLSVKQNVASETACHSKAICRPDLLLQWFTVHLLLSKRRSVPLRLVMNGFVAIIDSVWFKLLVVFLHELLILLYFILVSLTTQMDGLFMLQNLRSVHFILISVICIGRRWDNIPIII